MRSIPDKSGWLFSCALILALGLHGCELVSGNAELPTVEMEFLPEELKQPPAIKPRAYRLHPPYWERIHRDGVYLVADLAGMPREEYRLDAVGRKSGNGDSLFRTSIPFRADSSGRMVHLLRLPLGDERFRWTETFDLELILSGLDAHAEFTKRLAAARYHVVPHFEKLDLHRFAVNFYPDGEGMALRSTIQSRTDRNASEVREERIRKIERVETVAKAGREGWESCASDSLALLRVLAYRCTLGTAEENAATRCGTSLDTLLLSGGIAWVPADETYCLSEARVFFDSAEFHHNDWPRLEVFGASRLIRFFEPALLGGIDNMTARASGLGVFRIRNSNGVSGSYWEEDLVEVKR